MANRAVVAFRVSADDYVSWIHHLGLVFSIEPVTHDHELSLSVYFSDPDGNPYEITTYEHDVARRLLVANNR